MSYVCEIVNTATQACEHWAVYSPFLPELTDDARDELIRYVLKIFVGLFVFKNILLIINKAK